MHQVKAQRRIADSNHNNHLVDGIPEHRPTSMVPLSFLVPLSEETERVVLSRQREIVDALAPAIGVPFYADNGFILYEGDCVEMMQSIKTTNVRVDLSVTSPPYNIGKEYEKPMSVQEYIGWCSKWMGLIHDITNRFGAFWLNVGYLEVPDKGLCVPIPYLLWDKSLFYLLQEIVWHYGAGVAATTRLSPRNEKWLFYVRDPEEYTFNLDDIRDPNVKYPNQKKNGKFRCNPLGKNPSDVWEFPKVTTGENRSSQERTGHPAQFPLGVVERVILASSDPGSVILDPFAGSCSAGVAAVGLGRVFIGFEIRKDYCELATKRFTDFISAKLQAQQQITLF